MVERSIAIKFAIASPYTNSQRDRVCMYIFTSFPGAVRRSLFLLEKKHNETVLSRGFGAFMKNLLARKTKT